MPESTSLRERRRTETAAAIVDAGRALFRDVGYAATRTGDIARSAGLSEATLFRYFPAKSSIALAATGDRMDLVLELLATQPDGVDAVEAAFGVVGALRVAELFGPDDPVVGEIALVVTEPELRPALDARINAASATAAEVFARRAGRSTPELVDRVQAHAVVGAVQAAAEAWLADIDGAPFLDVLTEAFGLLALR